MAESESFLARWSRLKQDAAKQLEPEPPLAPEPVDGEPVAEAQEGREPAASEILPPIESLGADSDYRPFLAPDVPEALRWAALRKAWSTDPAIAGFRGLAEYDWDCNAPGFGQLLATDDVRRLCDAVLRQVGDEAEERPSVATVSLDAVSETGDASAAAAGSDMVGSDAPPTPLPDAQGCGSMGESAFKA